MQPAMSERGYRKVVVAPHDPAFARRAVEEGEAIQRALGEHVLVVHHIGSTALPIPAKPLLDLMPIVTDVAALDAAEKISAMKALGYEARGEYGIAERRFFTKTDAEGTRTHNVHCFEEGSHGMRRHLDFRDYLRAHPDEAIAYGALKEALAAQHPTDIDAYMDGKDAFIKEVEQRATRWRGR
jgi:GrpB-like predicted nucleotidyltransferase (UPF0157 family)